MITLSPFFRWPPPGTMPCVSRFESVAFLKEREDLDDGAGGDDQDGQQEQDVPDCSLEALVDLIAEVAPLVLEDEESDVGDGHHDQGDGGRQDRQPERRGIKGAEDAAIRRQGTPGGKVPRAGPPPATGARAWAASTASRTRIPWTWRVLAQAMTTRLVVRTNGANIETPRSKFLRPRCSLPQPRARSV